MPNIGAFIAWGLITALFIPTGWLPNASLAKLVSPMITYMLPILIGYTGGKLVFDTRGGVIGVVATLGIIAGSSVPMFMGAMLVGPLAAWVLKKCDGLISHRIRPGFEMLVNNFSLGIIGMVLAILSFLVIGPTMEAITRFMAAGVQAIVSWNLLPLANIFIEPGKILFLNNAINHGVLSSIGIEQSASTGKSIVFMLESDPGPGLGILLAYWVAGKGAARTTAPGAVLIHFLGGIHEIYFPYVLMSPRLILACIAGGVTGTFTFSILGAGLIAPPSPGSIFAYLAMTPKGGLVPVLAGVAAATAASFAVAFLLLKFGKQSEEADGLEAAAAKTAELKGSALAVSVAPATAVRPPVSKIVFSCDAGMGSSAMGASILRARMRKAGLNVTVSHSAINEIPGDADIVLTHSSLTDRARKSAPEARHISVDDFLKSPVYDVLVDELKGQQH